MKQGLSINQLAAKVTENAENKKDFIVPIGNIDFGFDQANKKVEFYAGVQGYGGVGGHLTDHALKQMTGELNIPATFVETLKAEDPLYLPELMNRRGHTKKDNMRMLRTIGPKMVAAVSKSFSRDYDNDIILKAVLPTIIEKNLSVQSCNVDDNFMHLKVTDTTQRQEIRGSRTVGDIVEAGVVCKNSDVGLSRAVIAEFIRRLVCENGMTSMKLIDAFKRTHRGSSFPEGYAPSIDTTSAYQQALAKEMRDVMTFLLSPERFGMMVQRMEESTQRQLLPIHLDVAVKELGRMVGFTQTEGDNIMAHLIEGGDLSQYGVMNAVTRYAHDPDEYSRASELEGIGSRILDINDRGWGRIIEMQEAA